MAIIILPDSSASQVVYYHKSDSAHVENEVFFTHQGRKLKIKQPKGVRYTTVVVNEKLVMEIAWADGGGS